MNGPTTTTQNLFLLNHHCVVPGFGQEGTINIFAALCLCHLKNNVCGICTVVDFISSLLNIVTFIMAKQVFAFVVQTL